MVEATGLNIMKSRSSPMSSSPCKISSKSTNRFKSCAHLRSLNVRHFWMAEATRLKKCDDEVTLNGSTYLPNFTKIHRSVRKLLVGDTQTDRHTHTHTHTHRQTGWWFDKHTFIFLKVG
jgi:hypothetical protein